MRETTHVVKEYVNKKLVSIFSRNIIKEDDNFSYLYNYRLKQNVWLRPYLVRLVYEVYQEERNWKNILPALAASEIFNISTYQSNIIFDKKTNNETHLHKCNQFIASILSYDIAIEMLNELPLSSDVRLCIINKLSSSNSSVYFGQHLDLNSLTVENIDYYLKTTKNDFLNKYLLRCKLIGGSTVECCCHWALIISNANKVDVEILNDIFSRWGMLMQVINDLSDYLIFIDNFKAARFSDLKHGKLTLPLYLLLKNGEIEINDVVHYNIKKINEVIPRVLFQDSDISLEILEVLFKEWILVRNKIKIFDNKSINEITSIMFENLFLTKFSRYFFSNEIIRKFKKQFYE